MSPFDAGPSGYEQREAEITKMIKSIEKVKDPVRVVPLEEVPEFEQDAKMVIHVPQAAMAISENVTLRTDNASNCNVFLIRTPQSKGSDQTMMLHNMAGDMDRNHEGSKRDDIKDKINESSKGIAITGGRSAGINPTVRGLAYAGLETKKHITVDSGKRYVSVVYRPKTDEILVRVGSDEDATEVYVYEGFGKEKTPSE